MPVRRSYLLKSDKLRSYERKQFDNYLKKFDKLSKSQIKEGLQFLLECPYKHFNGKKKYLC